MHLFVLILRSMSSHSLDIKFLPFVTLFLIETTAKTLRGGNTCCARRQFSKKKDTRIFHFPMTTITCVFFGRISIESVRKLNWNHFFLCKKHTNDGNKSIILMTKKWTKIQDTCTAYGREQNQSKMCVFCCSRAHTFQMSIFSTKSTISVTLLLCVSLFSEYMWYRINMVWSLRVFVYFYFIYFTLALPLYLPLSLTHTRTHVRFMLPAKQYFVHIFQCLFYAILRQFHMPMCMNFRVFFSFILCKHLYAVALWLFISLCVLLISIEIGACMLASNAIKWFCGLRNLCL